jgi:hypothetical protein
MIKNNRTLIVYFSRTGHTEKAANSLAKMIDGDLIEIKDTKNYSGVVGFLRGGFLAYRKKQTIIEKTDINPKEYDIVILCSPLWAGSITPAIRTFCNQFDLPNTAWLITCGDLSATVTNLPIPDTNIRTLIKIKDKDIANNEFEESLREFIAML